MKLKKKIIKATLLLPFKVYFRLFCWIKKNPDSYTVRIFCTKEFEILKLNAIL
jgi:hypothetical protein